MKLLRILRAVFTLVRFTVDYVADGESKDDVRRDRGLYTPSLTPLARARPVGRGNSGAKEDE